MTYGLGCNLILKRDFDGNVVFRDNGVAAAKVVINDISRFVEKFTSNLDNQQLLAPRMLSEIPTELFYEEHNVFKRNHQIMALGLLYYE